MELPDSRPRVIVELGMGDGRLLETIARQDDAFLYVGIELDNAECGQARSRITFSNVVILNGSFEYIVPGLLDESVCQFLVVLPDPAFIDQKREGQWKPLYRTIYSKLRKGGMLRLVTEMTDELLRPVTNDRFSAWADWLKSSFFSLGFTLAHQREGAPAQYLSRCIDEFRGDPERIRMITLDLVKQ
jgi:tRNA G46 methylase TrmB